MATQRHTSSKHSQVHVQSPLQGQYHVQWNQMGTDIPCELSFVGLSLVDSWYKLVGL